MKKEINKSYIVFYESWGEVVIDKIYVHPDDRGNKMCFNLLDIARGYACYLELDMWLCAESDEETLSNEKLIAYFKEYGFESDGDLSALMTYTY